MSTGFIGESGKWVLNTNNLNWIDVREGYMKDGKPTYCVIASFTNGNELSLFDSSSIKECELYIKKISKIDEIGAHE